MGTFFPGVYFRTFVLNLKKSSYLGFSNAVRFSQGKGFYIAAGGGSAYQSFTHIRKAIEDNRFDAKLVNLSDSICLLSIQGPKR